MLQTKKKKIGLTVAVILVVLAIVTALLLVLFNQSNQSVNARYTKLDTPTITGVKEEDGKYILSYSAVKDAITYEINIDGVITSNMKTEHDITSHIKEYRDYVIKVRAICDIQSFSSAYSEEYVYSHKLNLQPLTMNPISSDQISWSIANHTDVLYRLSVKSGDKELIIYDIKYNYYILSNAVAKFNAQYEHTRSYSFSVQAYTTNPMVTPSPYSNVVTYTYNSELSNFVLTLSTDNQLTFDPLESDCAIDYQLYLIKSPTLVNIDAGFDVASRQGTRVQLTPTIDEHLVTFDLNSLIKECDPEQYAVYVNAIPASSDPLAPFTAPSTSINVEIFKVEATLDKPTGLSLTKANNDLQVTWTPVKYTADNLLADYTFQILYQDDSGQFQLWKEATVDGINISAGPYGIPLDDTRLGVGIFKLRVQAYSPTNQFYLPSEWAESDTLNAVSTLNTPADFRVVLTDDLMDMSFNWSAVSNNSGYEIAILNDLGEPVLNASNNPVVLAAPKNTTQLKNVDSILRKELSEAGTYFATIRAIGTGYYNSSAPSAPPVGCNLLAALNSPVIAQFDDPESADPAVLTPIIVDRQTAKVMLYWTWAGDTNTLDKWDIALYNGDILATDSDLDFTAVTTENIGGVDYYALDISNFLNKSGNDFSVQVTAVAKPFDNDNHYINGVSIVVHFTYYKYFVLDESSVSITQVAGENDVTMSWSSNDAVDNYGSGYTIAFVDSQSSILSTINIPRGDSTQGIHITSELALGTNYIWLYANLCNAFDASNVYKTTYEYIYTIEPFTVDDIVINTIFSDEDKISPPSYELTFPIVKNVDTYTITINGTKYEDYYNKYDESKLGGENVIIIPAEKFLIFDNNTFSIRLSADSEFVVGDVGDVTIGDYNFYNAYNVVAPTLSSEFNLLDDKAIISWTWASEEVVTKVTKDGYTVEYEYSVERNSQDYDATRVEGENSLELERGGIDYTYAVYVRTVIKDKLGTIMARSNYSLSTYAITLKLTPPTNITVNPETNTVMWDAVDKATFYEIRTFKQNPTTGEFEVLTNAGGEDIRTTNVTFITVEDIMFKNGSGLYVFQVRSLRQGDPNATSIWSGNSSGIDFVKVMPQPTLLDYIVDVDSNTVKLSTEKVNDYNDKFKIYIRAHNATQWDVELVFTADGSDDSMQYTVQNGKVTFDITEAMNKKPAGRYDFGLIACDTSEEFSDSPMFVKDNGGEGCEYKKRLATPIFNITQSGKTTSDYKIQVKLAKPEPLDGDVYPNFKITYATDTDTFQYELEADDYKDTTQGDILITLTQAQGISANKYKFTIVAETNKLHYLNSNPCSVEFTVNAMFAVPALYVDNASITFIKNDEIATLQFAKQPSSSTKFDMTIKYYGRADSIKVVTEKTLNGCFATTNGDNYNFELTPQLLLGDATIAPGKYTVEVRYCANGNVEQSAWSNDVTIYYSQEIPISIFGVNGIRDGGSILYITIPTDITSIIATTDITATIQYSYNDGTDQTGSISTEYYNTQDSCFQFSVSEDDPIKYIWEPEAGITTSNVLSIILAFNQDSMTIGGTTYQHFTNSNVTILYTVNSLVAPTVEFAPGATTDVFKWQDSNITSQGVIYSYILVVTDILTGAVSSYTGDDKFDCSYTKANSVYKYDITVSAKNDTDAHATTTQTFYSYALTGLLPNNVSIEYDNVSEVYTLSWNNPYASLPEGAEFKGYKYVNLGGTQLSASGIDISSETHSITFNRETMLTMKIVTNSNTATYALSIVLDKVEYCDGELYSTNTFSIEIRLPILITDATTGLSIDYNETTQQYTARWAPTDGAVHYNIQLGTGNYANFTPLTDASGNLQQAFQYDFNGTNITDLINRVRVPGVITARISVAESWEDTDADGILDRQWVYIPTPSPFDAGVAGSYCSFTLQLAYQTIADLTFSSVRDRTDSTTFTKTLSWSTSDEYVPTSTTFLIYVRADDDSTTDVTPIQFVPTATHVQSNTITCNLTDYMNALAPGMYEIWVVIQGVGNYKNSDNAYVTKHEYETGFTDNYASQDELYLVYNQFVVTKAPEDKYIILPEAFVNYTNGDNGGTISVKEDYRKLYEWYIDLYGGFNTKYIMLTQSLDVANTITVTCNGTNCTTTLRNNNIWSDTDALDCTSKREFEQYISERGVELTNWNTNTSTDLSSEDSNKITIVASVDNQFYFYPGNNSDNANYTFQHQMYYQLPALNVATDNRDNADNILSNIYLALTDSGGSYINVYSGQYYDNSTGIKINNAISNRVLLTVYKVNASGQNVEVDKRIIKLTDYNTSEKYSTGSNNMFDLLTVIQSMGPGNYKFQVSDINDVYGTNDTYYTAFINSTPVEVSYQYDYKFSLSVTDNITSSTKDEDPENDDTLIYITLDNPTFDITATYEITLRGSTTVNGVTYTRREASYTVDVRWSSGVPSILSPEGEFSLVDGKLCFDAKTYILDDTLDPYYLGGDYTYGVTVSYATTDNNFSTEYYFDKNHFITNNKNSSFTYRTQYPGKIRNAGIVVDSLGVAMLQFDIVIPESIGNQGALINTDDFVEFEMTYNDNPFLPDNAPVQITPVISVKEGNSIYTCEYNVTNFVGSGGVEGNKIGIKYIIQKAWLGYYYNIETYDNTKDEKFSMPQSLPLPKIKFTNTSTEGNHISASWGLEGDLAKLAIRDDPANNSDNPLNYYYSLTITRGDKEITFNFPNWTIKDILDNYNTISNVNIYNIIKFPEWTFGGNTVTLTYTDRNVEDWISGDYLVPGSYSLTVAINCSDPNEYSSNADTEKDLIINKNWQFADNSITFTVDSAQNTPETWANAEPHKATLKFKVFKVDEVGTTATGITPTSFTLTLNPITASNAFEGKSKSFIYSLNASGNWEHCDFMGNNYAESDTVSIKAYQTYYDITINVGNLFDKLYVAGEYTISVSVNKQDGVSGTPEPPLTTTEIAHYVTLPKFVFNDNYEIETDTQDTYYTFSWGVDSEDTRYKLEDNVIYTIVGKDAYDNPIYTKDTDLGFNVMIVNTTRGADHTIYDNYNSQFFSYTGYSSNDVLDFCHNYQASTFTIQAINKDYYYLAGEVSLPQTYIYAPSLGAPTITSTNLTGAAWAEGDSTLITPSEKLDKTRYNIEFTAAEGSTAFHFTLYDSNEDLSTTKVRTVTPIKEIVFGVDSTKNDGYLYIYTDYNNGTQTKTPTIGTTPVGTIDGTTVTFTPTLRQLFINEDEFLSANYTGGGQQYNYFLIDKALNYIFSIKSWTDDSQISSGKDNSINAGHALAYGTLQHQVIFNSLTIKEIKVIGSPSTVGEYENSPCLLYQTDTTSSSGEFEIRIYLDGYSSFDIWRYKGFNLTISLDKAYTKDSGSSKAITNIGISDFTYEGNNTYYSIPVDIDAKDPSDESDVGYWIYLNLPNVITFELASIMNVPTQIVDDDAGSEEDIIQKLQNANYTKVVNYAYTPTKPTVSQSLTFYRQLSTPQLSLLMDNLKDGEELKLIDLVDNMNLVTGIASNVFISTDNTATNSIAESNALKNGSGVKYQLTYGNATTDLNTAQIFLFNTTDNAFSKDSYDRTSPTNKDLDSLIYYLLASKYPNGGLVTLTIQTITETKDSLFVKSAESTSEFNFYVRPQQIQIDGTQLAVDAGDFDTNNPYTLMKSYIYETDTTTDNPTGKSMGVDDTVFHIAPGKVFFSWDDDDAENGDCYNLKLVHGLGTSEETFEIKLQISGDEINIIYANGITTEYYIGSLTTSGTDTVATVDMAALINGIALLWNKNKDTLFNYNEESDYPDYTSTPPSNTLTKGAYSITLNKINSESTADVKIGLPYEGDRKETYFYNKVMLANTATIEENQSNATLNPSFKFVSISDDPITFNKKAKQMVFAVVVKEGTQSTTTLSTVGNDGFNDKQTIRLLSNNVLKNITTAGEYTIEYYFTTEVTDATTGITTGAKNIFPSPTKEFTYKHYVQASFGAVTYNVAQDGDDFVISEIKYGGNALNISFKTQIGQNGNWFNINPFNPSHADCFSTYLPDEILEGVTIDILDKEKGVTSEMLKNKQTNNSGYIQAGINFVRLNLESGQLVNGYTYFPAEQSSGAESVTFNIPAKYFKVTNSSVSEKIQLTNCTDTTFINKEIDKAILINAGDKNKNYAINPHISESDKNIILEPSVRIESYNNTLWMGTSAEVRSYSIESIEQGGDTLSSSSQVEWFEDYSLKVDYPSILTADLQYRTNYDLGDYTNLLETKTQKLVVTSDKGVSLPLGDGIYSSYVTMSAKANMYGVFYNYIDKELSLSIDSIINDKKLEYNFISRTKDGKVTKVTNKSVIYENKPIIVKLKYGTMDAITFKPADGYETDYLNDWVSKTNGVMLDRFYWVDIPFNTVINNTPFPIQCEVQAIYKAEYHYGGDWAYVTATNVQTKVINMKEKDTLTYTTGKMGINSGWYAIWDDGWTNNFYIKDAKTTSEVKSAKIIAAIPQSIVCSTETSSSWDKVGL